MTVAGLSMILGFCFMVAGIALWSVPASLVFAGLILFVSGGLELRQHGRRPSA